MTEDELRQESWANVIHAYGTYTVFNRRARRLAAVRKVRDFLGIAVPITLAYVAFNTNALIEEIAVISLGIMGLVQLLLAAWALVSGWDDAYAHASNSVRENNDLYQDWEQAARTPASELSSKVSEMRVRDRLVQQRDVVRNISEKEMHFGMRSALRRFQKACAGCGIVPQSMKATDCGVCGQF